MDTDARTSGAAERPDRDPHVPTRDDPTADGGPVRPTAGGRGWPFLLAGAAVVAALLTGLVLGRGMAPSTGRLDAVAVGFAQDMTTHHAQAVEMSTIAHRRVTDPSLNYLAEDVLTTQQGQIGMMSAWLTAADQPQTNPGEVMAWMGGAHTGPMPGMASRAQLEVLGTLPLAQLEEQYLRLMVRHHAGAIPMAAYAAAHTDSPEVAALARNIELGQRSEIRALNGLLTDRGLPAEPVDAEQHGGSATSSPEPSASPGHAGHGG